MLPAEHELCARWLLAGTRIAFALLVASFAIYALGILDPLVPAQEVMRLWSLPVDRYIAATGIPTGWGWLRLVGKADYLNFIGISVFVGAILVGYARIVPLFIARGERLHAWLAIGQIVVLVAALSGVLI
jgi:hypothetical protein